MKKIKFHQWFTLLIVATIVSTACSKKSFTLSNPAGEKTEIATVDSAYTPPTVIVVPDEKAKINKDDELYYDDMYGYRYWRSNDGKYYLDKKYNTALLLKRKSAAATRLTASQ